MSRLQGKRFFCTIDLRKGYHQIRLTDRAAKLLAVTTHVGLFLPTTAPFGFHGLPAYFQNLISNVVLSGLDGTVCHSLIDDIAIGADTFEELLERLEQVLERIDKHDLRINGSKTTLNTRSAVFLGHIFDADGKVHLPKRMQAIEDLQHPDHRSKIKPLIGLLNYFRSHCGMDFAEL